MINYYIRMIENPCGSATGYYMYGKHCWNRDIKPYLDINAAFREMSYAVECHKSDCGCKIIVGEV